jgi:hypothetical protein
MAELAIISHGAVYNSTFQVPANIQVNFFYDPRNADTILCSQPSHIPTICQQQPVIVVTGGQQCIEMRLTRADELGWDAGVYTCAGQMVLQLPLQAVTLSQTLNEINNLYQGAFCDVYILACGVPAGATVHPSRLARYNPGTGSYQQPQSVIGNPGYYSGGRSRRRIRRRHARRRTQKRKLYGSTR